MEIHVRCWDLGRGRVKEPFHADLAGERPAEQAESFAETRLVCVAPHPFRAPYAAARQCLGDRWH
jgi:hypothetical protein